MIFNISARDIALSLTDIVAPRQCIVCGRPLSLHERHLCIGCLADLPRTCFSNLPRNQLSDRFNELLQRDQDNVQSGGYSYATSLFFYRTEAGYSKITQKLKYGADFAAGRYFSSLLGKEMASSPLFSDVDLVIPVPLHPLRRWSRGYNQSEIIAEVLSEYLKAPMRTDLLVRKRLTKTQTKLSVEEKARNVSDAFALRKGGFQSFRHIIVVDDVFTTGATLASCFRTLRANCPSSVRISAATLACVGM